MTLHTLFGIEELAPKQIHLKQIKAVYEVLNVSEPVAAYLSNGGRYSAPEQVYEAFRFLMYETKEVFLTLHLDGKNKIVCCDLVSVGSLNQSIVHPREVFKTALLSNAAAVLLIHQTPVR